MAESNSFTSHFVELRSRLLNSLIFIFVIFIFSYIFAEHIYNFLVEPYASAVRDEQNSDVFLQHYMKHLSLIIKSHFCCNF